MSEYDAYLERQGQPDSDDDTDELIATFCPDCAQRHYRGHGELCRACQREVDKADEQDRAVVAAANLRRLLNYQEPNLEEYDDMEAA